MLSPFRYWPDEAGNGGAERGCSFAFGWLHDTIRRRLSHKKTRDISSILHVQANVRF